MFQTMTQDFVCLDLDQFLGFAPTYPIHLETDKYVLKTADKFSEIYQLFRLRFDCFLSHKQFSMFRVDIDQYDLTCDHIIVIDKASGNVCGTYRTRVSTLTDKFYSQNEFDIKDFLNTPGIKMELGRACIHPDFRNGHIIDLLWRGIFKYANTTQAQYLFGCSSVKTIDPSVAKACYNHLRNTGHCTDNFNITPVGKYKRDFSMVNQEQELAIENPSKHLPPLLRSYFHAGAMVYGEPAFDVEFDCIDFMTIIDFNNLNPSFKRRYYDKQF